MMQGGSTGGLTKLLDSLCCLSFILNFYRIFSLLVTCVVFKDGVSGPSGECLPVSTLAAMGEPLTCCFISIMFLVFNRKLLGVYIFFNFVIILAK